MVGGEYSSSLGIVGDCSSVCVVEYNSAMCVKGERLSGRVVRRGSSGRAVVGARPCR